MKKRRRRDIRIVITHPLLVRSGTNLLLLALFIAAFFTLEPSDTDWGLERVQVAKYAPVIAAAVSAGSLLLGVRRVPVGWPLVSLAAVATACVTAGVYTLIVHKLYLYQTFVGRGVCAIVFLPAYMVCLLPKERRYFGEHARRIVMMAVTVMFPILVAWRLGFHMVDRVHIYHEEVLYFAAAAGFVAAGRNALVRRVGGLMLVLACAMTIKLTGFALAVLVTLMLWLVETSGRPGESKTPLMHRRLWVTQLVFAAGATAALLASEYRHSLPGGTREIRMETYGERFAEFLRSPLWGSMFVGSPVMHTAWLTIPSHSDFLDLLAFGGAIGAGMFYVPVGLAISHGLRSIRRFVAETDGLSLFALTAVVCFLLESAFNPVLSQPKLVSIYWMSLGILLADRTIARAAKDRAVLRQPAQARPMANPMPVLQPLRPDSRSLP